MSTHRRYCCCIASDPDPERCYFTWDPCDNSSLIYVRCDDQTGITPTLNQVYGINVDNGTLVCAIFLGESSGDPPTQAVQSLNVMAPYATCAACELPFYDCTGCLSNPLCQSQVISQLVMPTIQLQNGTCFGSGEPVGVNCCDATMSIPGFIHNLTPGPLCGGMGTTFFSAPPTPEGALCNSGCTLGSTRIRWYAWQLACSINIFTPGTNCNPGVPSVATRHWRITALYIDCNGSGPSSHFFIRTEPSPCAKGVYVYERPTAVGLPCQCGVSAACNNNIASTVIILQ